MNLVLVNVALNQDNSVARSANKVASPAGTCIGGSGGQFLIGSPANSAIHMNVLADVPSRPNSAGIPSCKELL